MKKKMLGIFVVTLLIAATCITVAGTFKQSTEVTAISSDVEVAATDRGGWYNPTGAWKRYDNEVFATIASASPPGLGRYSIVCEGKSINPTWYGMFPSAVDLSLMFGEMVATGKNTYDFTLIEYAINETYNVVYFRLWNGIAVFTSEDTYTGTFTASIYGPDQDPFGEEPPEHGCWGTWDFPYYRIPVVPPCEV